MLTAMLLLMTFCEGPQALMNQASNQFARVESGQTAAQAQDALKQAAETRLAWTACMIDALRREYAALQAFEGEPEALGATKAELQAAEVEVKLHREALRLAQSLWMIRIRAQQKNRAAPNQPRQEQP